LKNRLPKIILWLAMPVIFVIGFFSFFLKDNPSVFVQTQKRNRAIMGAFVMAAMMVSFIILCVKFGENLVLLIAALFFAILLLYFLFLYLKTVMGITARMNSLAFTLLDPSLLEEELPGYLQTFGKRRSESEPFRQYYETWICILRGQFGEAQERLAKGRVCAPMLAASMRAMEAHCLLRRGEPGEAADICKAFEKDILLRGNPGADGNQLHLVALFYLESNERNRARWFFQKALELPTSKWASLALRYDLARLEEKEGDAGKALEHYRQAAELGPKTWMGQEAARRAEALGSGGA
jgi:tetratricopeptide (TPR) repeat protein